MDLDVLGILSGARYTSAGIIARNLKKWGVARSLPVEYPASIAIIQAYEGSDDWDLLLVGDGDDLDRVFFKKGPVFKSMPIVYLNYAVGVTMAGDTVSFLHEPFFACGELASMLCATEVWVISQYLKDTMLAHYSKFFKDTVLQELESKIRVVYLGFDAGSFRGGERIHSPVRILFPHRPTVDKGPGELKKFIEKLKVRDPKLEVTLVSHARKHIKVWDAIMGMVDFEEFGFVGREEFLKIVRSCDFVYSSALHENFGLAVMEAVSVGCLPVLPNRLAYSELYPSQFLYESTEGAVDIVMGSIGADPFDNSFVFKYHWSYQADIWKQELRRVYDKFYEGAKETKASQKLAALLQDRMCSQKELLTAMGWSNLTAWGRYRYVLRNTHGVTITPGPSPIYGDGEGLMPLF